MNFDLKISDILTLPTTIMVAITLSSGIILFSPDVLLEKMYIFDFRENYGFILGLVFTISLSILTVNIIYQSVQSITKNRNRKTFYATAEERLRKLNDYQKALIYLLYIQDNRTLPLPLYDGAVIELESKLIIGKAAQQYLVNDINNAEFPFHLQPWVSDELSNKKNLLDDFRHAYNIQSNKITSMNNWEW